MRKLLLCVGFAAVLIACGDNDMAGDDDPDAAVAPDAMVEPDAMVCPARAPGEIGGACDESLDCNGTTGSGVGYCLEGGVEVSVFPPEGYCTIDDFTGNECVTDVDCPSGTECVEWEDFADPGPPVNPYTTCLPSCACEGNACPAHQACFDSFNGYALNKPVCTPGDADAEDGDACDGFYECDEYSLCNADSIEYPAGQCERYGCTLGDDTTCNGGTCIANDPPFGGTTCVETCTSNANCRTPEGYVCYDPDGAGTAANYCRHPHVGDPCTTTTDCGGGVWICKPDPGFAGGYCTQEGCDMPGQSADDCSPGSACYDPLVGADENYCVDRCPDAGIGTQSTCRTGYLCIDTNADINDVVGGCVPTP